MLMLLILFKSLPIMSVIRLHFPILLGPKLILCLELNNINIKYYTFFAEGGFAKYVGYIISREHCSYLSRFSCSERTSVAYCINRPPLTGAYLCRKTLKIGATLPRNWIVYEFCKTPFIYIYSMKLLLLIA
jgi:hypothetical protein